MSPVLEQLIKKMTPQEQEEVETFAAFLLAKRDLHGLRTALGLSQEPAVTQNGPQ